MLHEVEQVCDSVTIISKGKLIAQGEVAQMLRSRGREQVRLRTTDNAKASEILSGLEWVGDVTTSDDSLIASAPHERSADLTAALSRSEVYVAEMGPVGTSLEEFFLEVTGGDERDER